MNYPNSEKAVSERLSLYRQQLRPLAHLLHSREADMH
jgi:hypothetical protein